MRKAVILSLIVSALWGANGLFVTYLEEVLGASLGTVLFLRHFLGGLPLIFAHWVRVARGSETCLKACDFKWAFLAGVFGLFTSNVANLVVMNTAGVVSAVQLTNLSVLFVLIIGCVLGKRLSTFAQCLGTALSIFGVALVVGSVAELPPAWVIALGLLSAFASGVYPYLFSKALEEGASPLGVVGWALFFAGVASFPVAAFDGGLAFAFGAPLVFLVGFLCAVVTRSLPQWLYVEAVALVEDDADTKLSALAVVTTLEVSFAAVFSFLFLAEPMGPLRWLGVGLCLFAAALVLRKS